MPNRSLNSNKFVVWSSTSPDRDFARRYKNHLTESFREVKRLLIVYQLDDRELIQQLSALKSETIDVVEFAEKYSFNGIINNGFLSHADRIVAFLDFIVQSNYLGRVDHCEDFLNAIIVFRTVSYFLSEYHYNRDRSKDSTDLVLFRDNFQETEGFLQNIVRLRPRLDNLHQKFHSYWARPSTRPWVLLVHGLLAFPALRFPKFFRLFNQKYIGTAFTELMMSASYTAPLRSMEFVDSHCAARTLRGLSYNKDVVSKSFRVPAQGRYILDSKKVGFVDLKGPVEVNHSIRCRMIAHASLENRKKTVIFSCHGGGMIVGRPEIHELYTKKFVAQCDGATFLCPDYTLKAIYPIAFQEILDVYLWLVSGDPSVEQKLGFHPEEIVITGDSAGGFLGMSLLNNIQRIKSIDPDARLILPKALVFYYGAFLACSLWAPSRLTTLFDPILPFGFLLLIIGCVTGVEGGCLAKTRPKGRFRRGIKYFGEDLIALKSGFHTRPIQPWYRDGERFRTEEILSATNSLDQTLFNSFNGVDFDSTSEISLYLYTTDKCVFLDDNIELCKKWKGPVELHVAKDQIHGFLLVPSEKEAVQFGINLLRKACKLGHDREENGTTTKLNVPH